MRKLLAIVLCILCLSPMAEASEEKYVALTFDDGPSGRFTRRLLEGLEARDAKATFLLCGYRLEQYGGLAAEMASAGHELGVHGYSHRDWRTLSRRNLAEEIRETEELLPEGVRIRFLRPPGGFVTDGIRQVAAARNLAILSWSVDPHDWQITDTAAIETSVVDNVRDGDIILLHDMSDSSVDAALAIVDDLTAAGFQFVTVSELAALRGEKITPGREYRAFPPEEIDIEK